MAGVFDLWGLRQLGAWRVTVLLHPTAAFFWWIWDISSAAWCTMGVMLLYGSQPVTEGGKKAHCSVIGCYVSSSTGWLLSPFWTEWLLICVINRGWWFSWRTGAGGWSMYACIFTNSNISIHIQDHPTFFETDEWWTRCSKTCRLLSCAFFFFFLLD